MCFVFLSQLCVGAEELYDNTAMLSYLVPLVVFLLITLLTDLYTFYHINYYKHSSEQFSAHHAEYYSLKDKCKICNTHCNDESIVVQKVDIPLKSTAISCILLAFIILLISIINISLHVWLFFTTVHIPMIVCLSTRNNLANMATERQRNNTLAWNRTRNQQWERKCALEDRIQNAL
jgi:hypothetical protein